MKHLFQFLSSLAMIIFFNFSNTAFAEQVKLPNTKVEFIKSQLNNINYRLYISFPHGYEKSKDTYPVIYLLDEDYSFAIAHNILEHLSDRKDLPKAILVAIGYDNQEQTVQYKDRSKLSNYKINRTRDYTPTRSTVGDGYGAEYDKFSGGGIKFKEFIKTELFPYINKHYRVNGNNTLVGHSYGGLFATWIYLTDNNMFNNYIAISPSLWYENNFLFSLFSSAIINKNSKLYISVGLEESKRMIAGIKQLEKELKDHSKLKTEILPEENHNTIFPTGLSHGLRFVFNGD